VRIIGKVFSGLGLLCYFVFGIWGFFLSLSIVHESAGFFGFVVAFALFPITFAAAPWYALFHWGTWFPLWVNYGGMIGSGLLRIVGNSLNPE
jgi:hypothetical protein